MNYEENIPTTQIYRLSVFMEREEKEENEEPLLLLSLKSYSNSRGNEERKELSEKDNKLSREKGNEAAALVVKTEHRSQGGNKLPEL